MSQVFRKFVFHYVKDIFWLEDRDLCSRVKFPVNKESKTVFIKLCDTFHCRPHVKNEADFRQLFWKVSLSFFPAPVFPEVFASANTCWKKSAHRSKPSKIQVHTENGYNLTKDLCSILNSLYIDRKCFKSFKKIYMG